MKIELTLKEAAEALGYPKEWWATNDYLDADGFDDVNHDGYSAHDAQNWDVVGMPDVEKIFPAQVGWAVEDGERDSYASAIGDARREAIKNAFEKIEKVTCEYETTDGEMVSTTASITSADVDAPENKVTVEVDKPWDLLNAIISGVGHFYGDLSSESDEESIKKSFLANIGDYFEVYGESMPTGELDSRYSPDVDQKYLAEMTKERVSELSADEVADAITDAVESDRIDDEAEAIDLAVKYSTVSKQDITKALKGHHQGKSDHHKGKADSYGESLLKLCKEVERV